GPDARRLPRPPWRDDRAPFGHRGRGVPQIRGFAAERCRGRRAARMPGALDLHRRQERRDPPRRLRREPARPRRRSLRSHQAPTVVARDTVVGVRMALADAQDAEISPPCELTYLHGGYGEMLPALEQALEGKGTGESVRLQLEPEQAFGEYDPQLLRIEPL